MKLNTPIKTEPIFTHEGAKAVHINYEQMLRRSVMSCLLWEKEFYENGEDIANRIVDLVVKVKPKVVMDIAVEARSKMNLRHVPLLIVKAMAKLPLHKKYVADTLEAIIQRPDELSEFLAIYWKDGKCPISSQVKKGLSKAFQKFNEYQLAKYNRDGTIKLRDVLFMIHAKPKDKEQEILWKKLVDNELQTPDTWEVALSSGANKKDTWERLLSEKKLGGLALLRNLRNMQAESVNMDLIKTSILSMNTERILPFRFIAASKYAPILEPELENAMFKSLKEVGKLQGKTILLVDVSGSMNDKLSSKSDMTRLDAGYGLAMLLREISDDIEIYSFSNDLVLIPNRRGFALADAINMSQSHSGTALGSAVKNINDKRNYDRLIVITDEQVSSFVSDPINRGYIINIASYRNGIGYKKWIHIDGWSEAVVSYIQEYEKELNN